MPTRPKEVFIQRQDGEKVPCELAFKGIDDELIGQWEVCTRLRAGDRLMIRGLGRNTVIAYPEQIAADA